MFVFRRILAITCIMATTWMASGCAINKASASLSPGENLSGLRQIYVVTLPADEHNVDGIIKDRLTSMGYSVTVGPEQTLPYTGDAVVTYQDKWMWDITMYMLELTVVLRNPQTNFPIATGNSMHTSLTRKSPEEMVDEVLTNIFNAK